MFLFGELFYFVSGELFCVQVSRCVLMKRGEERRVKFYLIYVLCVIVAVVLVLFVVCYVIFCSLVFKHVTLYGVIFLSAEHFVSANCIKTHLST